jgi:N-acetylneuraminic acid mutarotase
MYTTRWGWTLSALILSFASASCGPKDSATLKVNLGIPVQKKSWFDSFYRQANFISGPSCLQDQVFLLMAKQQAGIIYKKKIAIRSSLDTNNNLCSPIIYNNNSNGIDTAIDRLKKCSWLLEEPTIQLPSGIKVEVGIAGTFFEPKDVNQDGICDSEKLDYQDASPNQAYPINNFWGYFPPLSIARSDHSMTELNDGKILVFGGKTSANGITESYEIFRPESQEWQLYTGQNNDTTTSPILTARSHHTATKLRDGRVVIIGGKNAVGSPVAPIHIFKPDETWETPELIPYGFNSGLDGHTANLIGENEILIVGGSTSSFTSNNTSSTTQVGILTIADDNSLSWQSLTPMSSARQNHTATVIGDEVHIIGGIKKNSFSSVDPLDSIIKLNFRTQNANWVTTYNGIKRVNHTATLLSNNKIAIIGGITWTQNSTSAPKQSFEIYSPPVTIPGPAPTPIAIEQKEENFTGHSGHETILLPNGSLLVIGGRNLQNSPPITVEMFDNQISNWRQLSDKRLDTTGFKSIFYLGRKVVLTGGMDTDGNVSNQSETFFPGNRFAANQTSILGHQEVNNDTISNGSLDLEIMMMHGNPTSDYIFTSILAENKRDWTQIPSQFNSSSGNTGYTAHPLKVELLHGMNDGGITFPVYSNIGTYFQLPHLFPMKVSFVVESFEYCSNNSAHPSCGIYESILPQNIQNNTITLNLAEKYTENPPNSLSFQNGIINH